MAVPLGAAPVVFVEDGAVVAVPRDRSSWSSVVAEPDRVPAELEAGAGAKTRPIPATAPASTIAGAGDDADDGAPRQDAVIGHGTGARRA